MASPTVLAVSLLGMGLAGLYLAVGARVASRAGDKWPLRLFALFWGGMAAYGLLDAGWALAVASTGVPLGLSVAILHLKVASAVAAFFGLVAYLLSIYAGREAVVRRVAVGYALLFLLVTYYYVWRDPVGQHVTTWGAGLDYAKPGGAFWKVVVVLLFVPPAVSALAYAMLVRVIQDPASRRRVVVTALSLVVLFASLTLGWLNGKWPWWAPVEKMLALATAVAVLVAWRDPTPA